MYYYRMSPIDYWGGMQSVEEYCTALRKYYSSDPFNDAGEAQRIISKLQADLQCAMENMPSWAGHVTEGPCVIPLPDPENNCFEYAFVWKQNDNGTTFVVSPFELPWLSEEYPELQLPVY